MFLECPKERVKETENLTNNEFCFKTAWACKFREICPYKLEIRQYKFEIRQYKLEIHQYKKEIRQYKLEIRQYKLEIRLNIS